jgi:serpin B
LPRLKLENSYDLGGVLSEMGMARAFTMRAELGGISEEPLKVSFVKQKTFVAVNEEGTEAAAATTMAVAALAIRREEAPFRFVVDRPFFVAIRERQSGLILFLGAIFDPR